MNPRGDTPVSMRFTDSIVAGCLPVVLADGIDSGLRWSFDDDGAFVVSEDFDWRVTGAVLAMPWPLDWQIDYASFVVRVVEDDLVQRPAAVFRGLRRLARNAPLLACMRARMAAAAVALDFVRSTAAADSVLRASVAMARIVNGGARNDSSFWLHTERKNVPSQCNFRIQ